MGGPQTPMQHGAFMRPGPGQTSQHLDPGMMGQQQPPNFGHPKFSPKSAEMGMANAGGCGPMGTMPGMQGMQGMQGCMPMKGKGGTMPGPMGCGAQPLGAHAPGAMGCGGAQFNPRPPSMGPMPQQQFDPNMMGQQPNMQQPPMFGQPGCGPMGVMPGMHGMQQQGCPPMKGKGGMMQGKGMGCAPMGCGGPNMGCAGQPVGTMGCGCGPQFGPRPPGMVNHGFGLGRGRGMVQQPYPQALPFKSPPAPMPEPGVGMCRPPPRPQAGPTADEFGARLRQLRQEFAHLDLEIPPDIRTWSLEELEAYFRSGGINRPVSHSKPPEPPPTSVQEEKPDPAKASLTPKKRPAEGVLEYSVTEALDIQSKLREQFSESMFQDGLKALQERYPERKRKGHMDRSAFFEAFEALTLSVHAKVLPTLGIDPDWNGVREMMTRMHEAMKHPKVKKSQEEINVLMGLPRDAEFSPPTKDEEMFQYRPNADATVPEYSRPMVVDEDGDSAHEFLVEDASTGELRMRGPTALGGDYWYLVVQKPAAVIRAKPDLKSDMVGRKKAGKHIRGQKVVEDKWLQLHSSELVKLGVQEAWVQLRGDDGGSGDEPLLERVPM